MKKYLQVAIFILLNLAGATVVRAAGFEYAMATQSDESYLCAGDWNTCFTDGSGLFKIPLGQGSKLGTSTIQSVTIAKDPTAPYIAHHWIIQINCYTDSSYSINCTNWSQPNPWNVRQSSFIVEFATSTQDQKHWTAYFTNTSHESNFGGVEPITFNPNYYYQLTINDNGWSVGAYGSQSLSLPYYKITGYKDSPDPVIVIPGILGSWEKNEQWVLDPILHTYDNLLDTFAANGYVKDKTLFAFPYNWEQPNEVTAFELKNKIAEVKTICGCSKVNLIGHSMGGLVAINYIERDDYAGDVDKLFLLAPPLSGSPKAYKAWEAGEIDFGDNQQNTAMSIKFSIEAFKNGYTNIFSYIRNKPIVSIQELLPVKTDYLKIGDNFLPYPHGYPQNAYLEKLLSNFNKITSREVAFKTILADTKTDSTIGSFTIASSTKPGLWADGQPIATTFVAGDNTVPRTSIENITIVDKEFDSTTHQGIASTSTPYLFKEITGKNPNIIVGKIYSHPFSSYLQFQLLSPIDMQITAPDGKKLGKDFSSNTEINEIPDAFYSGFLGDNEYAIIPNPLPGQYRVDTIGTGGGGHYTIVADYSDQATSSLVFVTGTSTPAVIETHSFIVSATSTAISLPPPPIATTTPTTTPITPDTCISSITKAYQDKWIGKKMVYENLILDCKTLKMLFLARDTAKNQVLINLALAAIRLTLADMDLLAKDKSNTKDAVLLIGSITTWFRNF